MNKQTLIEVAIILLLIGSITLLFWSIDWPVPSFESSIDPYKFRD